MNKGRTETGETTVAASKKRLYYLDWLRIIAILCVFIIHVLKFFDYHTVTIFNGERSLAGSMVRDFVLTWVMPLFFIISGASIFYSLDSRGVLVFLKERFLRIFVPALFIGTFVINPPQIYFQKLFSGDTARGFIEWYSTYFDGLCLAGGNFAPLGIGTHIWYLQYLFVFSLVFLPLFITGKKTGKSVLARLSGFFEKPAALFLLFVPLSAAAMTVEKNGLGFLRITGNWDPFTYVLFFLFGYMVFSNEKIRDNIKKYSTVSFVAAVVLTCLHLATHFGIFIQIDGLYRHNNEVLLPLNASVWIWVLGYKALLAWLWGLALLGLGQRFLNFKNNVLVYANEAVLPFYILHYTIIIAAGFYAVALDLPVFVKIIIITVVSFVITMVLYELVVKRVRVFRFLMGMKFSRSDKK